MESTTMNAAQSAAQRARQGAAAARIDGRYAVSRESGCWEWTGARLANGYGVLLEAGKRRYAHRVSYERAHGRIADSLVIDHLCRNTCCINPGHLEPVTLRENFLRGAHPLAVAYRTNTCLRGHDLLKYGRSNGPGKRTCGLCRRNRVQRNG